MNTCKMNLSLNFVCLLFIHLLGFQWLTASTSANSRNFSLLHPSEHVEDKINNKYILKARQIPWSDRLI